MISMRSGLSRLAALPALLVVASLDAAAPAPARSAVEPVRSETTQLAKRPNVLFILVDDLRPDLGIYGHPVAQTPNIDALGRSGLVFDNAFVSQAVCGPSRAALMTGLRPDTTGITNLETPVDKAMPGTVTMLDLFKRAGYETLGFGKVYHHLDDDADGWTLRTLDYEKELRQADRKAGEPRRAAAAIEDRNQLPDTLNVNLALAKMPELAKSQQPFFMAVGIHRPHLPFIAPRSEWARYSKTNIPAPINPDGQKNAPPWALVSYEVWNYSETKAMEPNMTQDMASMLRHGYLAAVSYADSLVGQLLDELKRQGLDKNTIIVLWGDHGFKLGDHAAWAKHSNAEIDIHIPLIIRAPGITQAGSRSSAIVETVDIYPTLAELAELNAPDNLEGLSMRPLLARPEQHWKSAAFARYHRNAGQTAGNGALVGYTVRTDRYRYTAWVGKTAQVVAQELYDLRHDRIESENVAGQSAYARALRELEMLRRAGPSEVRKAVARPNSMK